MTVTTGAQSHPELPHPPTLGEESDHDHDKVKHSVKKTGVPMKLLNISPTAAGNTSDATTSKSKV